MTRKKYDGIATVPRRLQRTTSFMNSATASRLPHKIKSNKCASHSQSPTHIKKSKKQVEPVFGTHQKIKTIEVAIAHQTTALLLT